MRTGCGKESSRAVVLMSNLTSRVPPYFSNENDMFSRLGAKVGQPTLSNQNLSLIFFFAPFAQRPHYRWLIIGPKKSGSSWHMDPNGTSAWNALVRGCKRWIMCPPQYTPPGVLLRCVEGSGELECVFYFNFSITSPSPDGTAVTSPISLMEWFVNFYDALTKSDIPFVEATLHTGEMIFVPRGWWHVVLNLEDSIAVTQNYAPPSQLPHTLHFLRDKSDQVSGVPRGKIVARAK